MRGRDFNAEYTDQLGRTPLHLAVVNDHKEVSVRAGIIYFFVVNGVILKIDVFR